MRVTLMLERPRRAYVVERIRMCLYAINVFIYKILKLDLGYFT